VTSNIADLRAAVLRTSRAGKNRNVSTALQIQAKKLLEKKG